MKSQLKWLATATCVAVWFVCGYATELTVDNFTAVQSVVTNDGGGYSYFQFALNDSQMKTSDGLTLADEVLSNEVVVSKIAVGQRNPANNKTYSITVGSWLLIQEVTALGTNNVGGTLGGTVATTAPLAEADKELVPMRTGSKTITLCTWTLTKPVRLSKSKTYRATFYNASNVPVNQALEMVTVSNVTVTTSTKIHASDSANYSPYVRVTVTDDEPAAGVAKSATLTAADGTWTDLPWDPAGTPAIADTVTLSAEAARTVTLADKVTISGLTLSGTGPFNFAAASGQTPMLIAYATTVNADTDVSGIKTNLGTVTLGTNKTLTVGNGYFPSGIALGSIPVSGSGTLALDLGASNSVDITGSNTTSGKTFGLLVKSGILNFSSDSGGNGPAKGRIITVSGSNSVLKFSAKDATGWITASGQSLTIADGAKLQVAKRDTFSTPLTLQGATLELLNGANETSRGFDWFKQSNELSVLQALGAGAENITESKITYASNAGENDKKFAVRIDDDTSGNYGFFVNVEPYARLTIGVPIIKVGKGLAKIAKRGLGEMVITAEGTHGLPVTVEAGTLKVKGAGTLSTGAVTISSNANLTVEVDTSVTKTLSNAISGAGTVKKSGAGTLSLTGSVRTPVEVAAGTLDIGTNRPAVNALASGAVLKVKATVAELIAQRITFPVGAGLTTFANSQLLVVDNAGSAVKGFSAAVADGTLTITLPSVLPTLTVNADGTQTWTNSASWPTSGAVKIDATAVTEITETKTITFPASEASRFSEVFVLAPAGDLVTLAVEAGNTIEALSLSGSVAMDVASANAATNIEVTDGAKLTLSTKSPATLTAAISGAGALSVASGKITVVPVLAHTGGTEIVKGSTVVISAANALGTAKKITGGGTIETSVLPSCNLKNEEWTGTLRLTAPCRDQTDMDWQNYGNKNSFFEIPEGVTISGYFNPASWELAAKVILNGSVTINNGYSGTSGNTYKFTGA